MISTIENLIIIKNEIVTAQIESCRYSVVDDRYLVVFKNNKTEYKFSEEKIIWLTNPEKPDPKRCVLYHKSRELNKIETISVFSHGTSTYWHVRFQEGEETDYLGKNIHVVHSCLKDRASKIVFDYLKEVAGENPLVSKEGIRILAEQYNAIEMIRKDTALANFLNPLDVETRTYTSPTLIYPFGSNASQLKAVKSAFENQISVIQGPPGTGKTQTILNVIANILISGKTVQVVSNNNSAIVNVAEKLEKQELGYLVAFLGKKDNKDLFIAQQRTVKRFPQSIASWQNQKAERPEFIDTIRRKSELLHAIFAKQERLAQARQELQALETEWEHFRSERRPDEKEIVFLRSIPSSDLIDLWNEYQLMAEQQPRLDDLSLENLLQWGKWIYLRLKSRFFFRIYDPQLFNREAPTVIAKLQSAFYEARDKELRQEIERLEQFLATKNADALTRDLSDSSLLFLKHKLFERFQAKPERPIFEGNDLRGNSKKVLREYPVILSTTFSSRSSLNPNTVYDYLIMDEASQVSIETGALALSCARNVIIVGDSLQLPNVVTNEDHIKLDAIFRKYDLPEGYDCAKNSFLEALCKVMPNVPQTLLREHYRCHPKIINFCNQKFYGGNLLIMTKDKGEKDVISAIKTVVGNHSRKHVNQREIDVIRAEVLPRLPYKSSEIGIISPFNDQVNALSANLGEGVDVATVHKFQGREKEAIIMSVVDDQITSFADDPNLLNVAVSRAKEKFQLVVSGNPQSRSGNITDLMAYIEYENCTVSTSKIHSVYDLLYKQYTAARINYLKRYKRISAYDSENLTYALIRDILRQNPQFRHLDVICHLSLKMLIRDFSVLNEEERRYASHSATHLDFLIYNRVGKKAVLAIETDGYAYHQQGGAQYERDRKKDRILRLYALPLVRLSTTGSNERKIIVDKLMELI